MTKIVLFYFVRSSEKASPHCYSIDPFNEHKSKHKNLVITIKFLS
jgi:hypothetical protein